MNEYIITFTAEDTESGKTETYKISVVDRTEAAAKKFFRETAKECGRTFQSIELLRTDVPATKRNERETLEIIRQLVADLGEQSYLATAFQGCFEDAEDNIDDDAAYSYKGRYEHVREQLDEAKKKIEELEGKLTQEIAEKQQARDEAQAVIKKLEAKALSEDDLEDIRQLLDDRATEADEKAEKAAAEIVRFAEATGLPEFRQAVTDHRNYIKDAKYYRELLGRVVEAQDANHAGA